MQRPNGKSKQYQKFYMKKLHTQSFSSPSFKDQFTKLTDKLEHQIQVVKKQMRVKHLKMFRAKEKFRTIENQHQQMRETLRNSIQNKLKLSQSKLENLMMTKHSQSNSKEKLRQTTLCRIKSMEQASKEESFRKSQNFSKESETFLIERKTSESRARVTSYAPTPTRTRYIQNESNTHQSQGLIQSRKKILPTILKVTDKEIKLKQIRKHRLEESKDIKNLHQYIKKLNIIDLKRQTRSDKLTQTVKLIEKQRKNEQQRYQSRKKVQSLGQRDKTNKNLVSATRDAIKNKYSFSELYTKKLEEKLVKKAFFENQSIRQGDSIMIKQGKIRKQKRQDKLLSQAIGQVQRKVNFRYMERYRS